MTDAGALPPLQPAAPVLVGYSGGLDSTVLLHALSATPGARGRGLRAIHVHHGLHPDADRWAEACSRQCVALGVPIQVIRVEVREGGDGLEAAARAARHAAFASALAPGEWLALAHHRDDQAETVLLRLLRASGSEGLAGMRGLRPFADGALWRPLLGTPRPVLQAYAEARGLSWIEDPANADPRFDRNFLRRQLLPLWRQRWPQVDAALARSAALLAEDADLLAGEARRRLSLLQGLDPATLSLPGLMAQPAAWRSRLLRAWIADLRLPPLPAPGVVRIEQDLLPARPDAVAAFAWQGAVVRRWRDLLYAGVKEAEWPTGWQVHWDGSAPLPLPDGKRMALIAEAPGLTFDSPLRVACRSGGERIVLPGRRHSHSLKHALQDLGLPPWQRPRLPLLFAGDELLAVGDVLVGARLQAWLRARGACLRLQDGRGD